jgi:uncharacterized protein (TIGR02757 family)
LGLVKSDKELKLFLDEKFQLFYNKDFIPQDPLSIPHRYDKLQDKEIMAFWTAMISWGNRKSIINSANKISEYMGGSPYDFILNHSDKDLTPFETFVHRTFQPIDALGFISFFRRHYQTYDSLEDAFLVKGRCENVKSSLIKFHNSIFTQDREDIAIRTKKHIATPANKASCKRLNMFLRWMVREGKSGIDLGLWKRIKPAQLMMPLDVHVERVSRSLGLITRKQSDWQTVEELTENLRLFDQNDPVKYDYALFGLGVTNEYPI